MSSCYPKDLEAWSRSNWNRVPALIRQDCLNELADKVPPELLKRWCSQIKAGRKIGSDDRYFHFNVGMAVRNALRAQLLDEELPPVTYPGGTACRNWDDFYTGALQELVEQAIANGG